MYDAESGLNFGLYQIGEPKDNTSNPFWWKDHVPIWTSATKAGDINTIFFKKIQPYYTVV